MIFSNPVIYFRCLRQTLGNILDVAFLCFSALRYLCRYCCYCTVNLVGKGDAKSRGNVRNFIVPRDWLI